MFHKKGIFKSFESRCDILTSVVCFLLALITYWFTVAPAISFWDCPEYAATAVGMEIGHSPGNPTWTLVHRIIAIIAPEGYETLFINLASGLFTALAVMFTSRIAFTICRFALSHSSFSLSSRNKDILSAIAAAVGAMSLAWCDSAWFSAVEAEVYALSLMLTALTVWIMTLWAKTPRDSQQSLDKSRRLLILCAYVIGVSIGVHQLNLLVIPAFALLMAYRLNPSRHRIIIFLSSLLAGCGVIILLLAGMMPGTIQNACDFEILAVNTLQLPYNSGALFYICLTILLSIATVTLLQFNPRNLAMRILCGFCMGGMLFCSGVFFFLHSQTVSLFLSITIGLTLSLLPRIPRVTLRTSLWMLFMTLTGFSIYLLIPIRSSQMPPMNESTPATPFDFQAYIQREQYGAGKSLLKAPTPYSRPLMLEEFDKDSTARYNRFALEILHPVYRPSLPGMQPSNTSRNLSSEDSTEFYALRNRKADAWLLTDYTFKTVNIPELDMWFSRLTGRTPDDIKSYAAWAGMDSTSMDEVEISEALDAEGNAVGKMGADGKRHKGKALRPTMMQHLRMLLGYQTGYMYLRYLMWNFSGRQNDIPSTGESDHGNFITGIQPLDDAMLGPQRELPPEARDDNPGFNRYFMLPLLLGIIGAAWLACSSRQARRLDTVILMLFLLTGVAIVVYLNQNTGEARERDYSFLGSYMAFSLWISAGAAAFGIFITHILRRFLKNDRRRAATCITAAALCAGIPLLMVAQNYDDHDRSRRTAASDFACNILNSLEPNAIVIVDGDNLTFPLWYAQEVLHLRPDVRVVSATYMAQPRYIVQLMTDCRDSRALPFTARPSDVLSGRFSSVYYSSDESKAPVDAMLALRNLYNDTTQRPRIHASRLTLPGLPADSFCVKLRETASGSPNIKRRQLMLLDLYVTNMASANPRPVYILNSLNKSYYSGLHPLARPSLFAYRLPPYGNADTDSADMRYIPRLRFGGFELHNPPYVDFTVYREASVQRAAILMLAKRRLKSGHRAEAYRLAKLAITSFPPHLAPYRTPSNMGGPFEELYETADILYNSASTPQERQYAISLLSDQLRIARQWRHYIDKAGKKRTSTISRRSRNTAAQIPRLTRTIDSLQNDSRQKNIITR